MQRNELSISKAALVWKCFYQPTDITSAHTSSLFFGAADPGDDTYDGTSWETVKISADLEYDSTFEKEEHFYKMPTLASLSSPPTRPDVIPIKSCTKADLDRVLEERRLHSTPRDGSLRNPGPNFSRLSTQANAILDRLRQRNASSLECASDKSTGSASSSPVDETIESTKPTDTDMDSSLPFFYDF